MFAVGLSQALCMPAIPGVATISPKQTKDTFNFNAFENVIPVPFRFFHLPRNAY
jgi:hypothetical protein